MKQLATLSMFLLLVLGAGIAQAQDTGLKSVSGTVVSKDESPLREARVYMQNVRNLTVRTYISGQDGQYHFTGLDPNVDYEIHAESDDMTSNTRTISSFDGRKDINVVLKVDKPLDKRKKADNK